MDPELRWRLPYGVVCAFSVRADGDVRDPQARADWLGRVRGDPRSAVVRQVHGAVVVDAAPDAPAADADAQVTNDPTLAVVAFGADCPGLCVAAPDLIGVAHCGWRGTSAGVVGNLVAAMARRSRHPPTDFAAFVGPGIAGDDYEVDAPVLEARPWPDGCVRAGRPGHAWLDLVAAITHDLGAAGVSRITATGVRTSRDPRLWSFRRHGGGLVQGLAGWRETSDRRGA